MTVTIGELCMGYGGLGMGLSMALGGDTRVAWAAEFDKHPSTIIAHRYPGVPNYGDVKTTDWTQVEPVDWLTAGYPCQPFALSGLRKGEDDERHVWPSVAQAIGVLRPRFVLLENVDGHRSLGLIAVLADLAALGYVGSWRVVRASDAGAPHRRERVFIVARDADRVAWSPSGAREGRPTPMGQQRTVERAVRSDRVAGFPWGSTERAVRQWERILGRPAPRPLTSEKLLSARFVEWMMGLPDGWVTDIPWPGLSPEAQLTALGNGVVPQQAALACRLLGVTAEAVAA